eukprot:scaffold12258_cov94-Skeletonema_marinoi.AAC.3
MDKILPRGLSLQRSREMNFHSISEAEAPTYSPEEVPPSEGWKRLFSFQLQSFCHESCMNFFTSMEQSPSA